MRAERSEAHRSSYVSCNATLDVRLAVPANSPPHQDEDADSRHEEPEAERKGGPAADRRILLWTAELSPGAPSHDLAASEALDAAEEKHERAAGRHCLIETLVVGK